MAPSRFAEASGSVIRKALQTLEAIKWVEKHPDGSGRIISRQVYLKFILLAKTILRGFAFPLL